MVRTTRRPACRLRRGQASVDGDDGHSGGTKARGAASASSTLPTWPTLASMPRHAHVRVRIEPRHRTRMSRTKPSAMTGTAELNAMIKRVAPDILALLADGVPRRKDAIVKAL